MYLECIHRFSKKYLCNDTRFIQNFWNSLVSITLYQLVLWLGRNAQLDKWKVSFRVKMTDGQSKSEALTPAVNYQPNNNGGYSLKNGKKGFSDFFLLKETMHPIWPYERFFDKTVGYPLILIRNAPQTIHILKPR